MTHQGDEGRGTAATSARGTWSWRAKSAYSAVARGIGKVLTAARLLPVTPPPRSQRVRHWLVSLSRVHDSLGIADLGVPWWTYRAMDAVEAWIDARPAPVRVFEWGSGASTLWLADRVDEIVTVEHHPEFSRLIRPVLALRTNVTFLEVPAPPTQSPRIDSQKAGSEDHDFYDYIHAIDDQVGSFDLIVIDGRSREACLGIAVERLEPDGLIVFDNSHRARYRAAIAGSGLAEQTFSGLTPTLPYPDRTSLLRLPPADR